MKDFYHTLNIWMEALERYSFEILCAKPSPQSWSTGQVYEHLYSETSYYLEQAKICLHSDDDAKEEMTSAGKMMFANNAFPDELIEGPPENTLVPQPHSKEALKEKFLRLMLQVETVEKLIAGNTEKGKTKHPGLGFFNAMEWVQFADMHLRHHLRQKNRIDKWLQQDNLGLQSNISNQIKNTMSERDIFIKMGLAAWQMQISRFNQLLDKLSDEQLLADTAPGRNSGKYILGHLTAVHDNLLQQLNLGSKLYPELDAIFVSSPDKSGVETPELPALKQYWHTVNDALWEHFEALPAESWFDRHALISEEDFAKEPYRNKLNMVINRAAHVSYHLGQMVYLKQ